MQYRCCLRNCKRLAKTPKATCAASAGKVGLRVRAASWETCRSAPEAARAEGPKARLAAGVWSPRDRPLPPPLTTGREEQDNAPLAISKRRLIGFDATGVSFRDQDYRRDGADRQKVMRLATDEFIRRFLLHVLPQGFHRIRHYGLLAGGAHKASLALARRLLEVAPEPQDTALVEPANPRPPCPCCGGRIVVIESFERWCQPRAPPTTCAPHRETAP